MLHSASGRAGPFQALRPEPEPLGPRPSTVVGRRGLRPGTCASPRRGRRHAPGRVPGIRDRCGAVWRLVQTVRRCLRPRTCASLRRGRRLAPGRVPRIRDRRGAVGRLVQTVRRCLGIRLGRHCGLFSAPRCRKLLPAPHLGRVRLSRGSSRAANRSSQRLGEFCAACCDLSCFGSPLLCRFRVHFRGFQAFDRSLFNRRIPPPRPSPIAVPGLDLLPASCTVSCAHRAISQLRSWITAVPGWPVRDL
mmetsp:Transcript_35032/g.83107  ORF Transcript_35032/g.83107 Transcript_35032/m.83107 type:complete len:248 (-) Transcript_35032:245-988(-)